MKKHFVLGQAKDLPTSTLAITGMLRDFNNNLDHALQGLVSQQADLSATIQPEGRLPDPEVVKLATRAVDLTHQIQVMLDPPVLILADHFFGYMRSKCLLAAVEKGVPDALEKHGPATLDQLSVATNAHGDRLCQVLRILCNAGIFTFDASSKTYANNPASTLLCVDHPSQWHNWVRLYAGDQFYHIACGIPASLDAAHPGSSARSAAQVNYDTDDNMFAYFQARGWMPMLHRTLGGGAAAQMPGILEDYPWQDVEDEFVLDIGGGSGSFLAGLLQRNRGMRGGIYDLPHVIEHVRPFFQADGQYADVADRVKSEHLIGGDFFKYVPPSAVYTMKWCLHDWKDPQAIEILGLIRTSIISTSPGSRLIVLESVLSNDQSGRLSQYGDINMMMTADGQERTEEQWRYLAKASGWKIEESYKLRGAWVNAMDFRPVTSEVSDQGKTM